MMAKFSSQSTQSRTREEVEKIKWSEPTPLCVDFLSYMCLFFSSLISEFCVNMISSMACYSLRQQVTVSCNLLFSERVAVDHTSLSEDG